MQQFNLISGTFTEKRKPTPKGKKSTSVSKNAPRGCSHCPLDKVPHLRKVLGLKRLQGRRAMLWPQSPGATENAKGLELVGTVGKFLWQALKPLGLTRNDFDIQNVLRCRPADEYGFEHVPTSEELHCCSIYNERALEINDGKAVVHLVLGKVAGAQLLGKALRKDTPIFWHEPWNAYVVYNDHPSYIVRSGGEKAGWLYEQFCLRLRAVPAILQYPGRWGYVYGQPYEFIYTAEEAEEPLRFLAEQDVVSVDIEDGMVEDTRRVLMIACGWGNYKDKAVWNSWSGGAYVFILDHPENRTPTKKIQHLKEGLKGFLENSTSKVLHHGSYDNDKLKSLMNVRLHGYQEDSQYSAYLARPHLQKYGLNAMAQKCFPEFGDYKLMPAGYDNYANVPLDRLARYCGADSDLSLRIFRTTFRKPQQPLLRVYTKAAVTLSAMEGRGPYLDYKALEKVDAVLPMQIDKVQEQLRIAAQDPNLNPNAPAQIATLLYDKLKLPTIEGSRSTGAETLQILHERTGHEIPKLVQDFRYLSKAKTTYVNGYRRSADMHGGQLRTHWHLTGAATGRLRSGGTEDGYEGVINFQNFHGNPLLKNLLVSDPEWRHVLGEREPDELLNLVAFLAFDYSQIEIRMLAETTEDPLLIRQFNSGLDIHCLVGHELTGWAPDKIAKDKEVRRLIKNLHFGIVYGISKPGLYDYLIAKGVKNITHKKTEKLHDAYFARYKGVARWISKARAQVERLGYAENIFGFRRPIGDWDSRSTYWGNQAINTPIQGAAHTLLLIALALLAIKPKTYRLLQVPVMEVHDALDFYVPLRDLKAAYQCGLQLFQKDIPDFVASNFKRKLQIPLLAEAEAGFCLGTMVEYKDSTTTDSFLRDWRRKHTEIEKVGWEKLMPTAA